MPIPNNRIHTYVSIHSYMGMLYGAFSFIVHISNFIGAKINTRTVHEYRHVNRAANNVYDIIYLLWYSMFLSYLNLDAIVKAFVSVSAPLQPIE
jgi:hypothetical protein